MDIGVAVQALEVSLRGFCYPAIYLNADKFSTGASEDLVALVSQILERCHPSIQAYLSSKGYYTPLTKFTGLDWYRCFESFMRDNVHTIENPSAVPIIPSSSWEKSSFAVAKVKEVLGFVRVLKAAVPKKKRSLQEHRPTSSLTQALKTSRVGLEGVELTTPDDCNSKQMLRFAFDGAESTDSFEDAIDSESRQYHIDSKSTEHQKYSESSKVRSRQSSSNYDRARHRNKDYEDSFGGDRGAYTDHARSPRSLHSLQAPSSLSIKQNTLSSDFLPQYSRPSSSRRGSVFTELNEYTVKDVVHEVEKAVHGIQVLNAKVDAVFGRLDFLEQRLDEISTKL